MQMIISEKKNENDNPVIVLQGEMIINNIAECLEVILDKLTSEKPIQIDLLDVNKIDTAGLQLLLAARNSRKNDNMDVELINPSSEVERIFNLYGLEVVSYAKISCESGQ